MKNLLKLFDFLFPRKPATVKLDAEALEVYTKKVEDFHKSIHEKLPDRYRSEIRLAFYHGILHERHRK